MKEERYQVQENPIRKRSIKIAVGALAAVVLIVLITTVGKNLAQSQEVRIRSIEELEKIGHEDGYPLDGTYLLEEDLDGGGKTIEAIGTEEEPFAGHFDGQGHTISNLTVEVKKVREIRTKEVVKQVPDENTAGQNGADKGSTDQNGTGQDRTDQSSTGERTGQKNTDRKKEKASQDSQEKASQSSQKAAIETTRYLISVDGYPLFEYTSEVKPGQIENLCLDGLKTQERTEPEETEKQKTKENTAKKEAATNQEAANQEKAKPIEIHNWEEFKNIGNTKYNKAYTMDADYLLVNAIKSDGKKFTPIGTEKNPFTGTFDGQGRKIDVSKNKEIKTDGAYNGLFGVVKPAAKEDGHEE